MQLQCTPCITYNKYQCKCKNKTKKIQLKYIIWSIRSDGEFRKKDNYHCFTTIVCLALIKLNIEFHKYIHCIDKHNKKKSFRFYFSFYWKLNTVYFNYFRFSKNVLTDSQRIKTLSMESNVRERAKRKNIKPQEPGLWYNRNVACLKYDTPDNYNSPKIPFEPFRHH